MTFNDLILHVKRRETSKTQTQRAFEMTSILTLVQVKSSITVASRVSAFIVYTEK